MYVVADTNVLLSAYLFRNSTLAWLRAEADAGRLTFAFDPPTAAELKRVLAYPKFNLHEREQTSVLLRVLVNALVFENAAPADANLPTCRDAADQKFLCLTSQVVMLHPNMALVTGDQDLLVLRGQCHFPICKPTDLQALLAAKRAD